MKHRKPQDPACPTCGLQVFWDIRAIAWKHEENKSRWCPSDNGPVFSLELQGIGKDGR